MNVLFKRRVVNFLSTSVFSVPRLLRVVLNDDFSLAVQAALVGQMHILPMTVWLL